jgi:hypothetical protein
MNTSTVIAIGGLGGSGTRLLAEFFRLAGVDMGNDLNKALDDLWFTALFREDGPGVLHDKELLSDRFNLYRQLRAGKKLSIAEWKKCRQFAHELKDPRLTGKPKIGRLWRQKHQSDRWGWKEPNTHWFTENLLELHPGLHYIHMTRDGRYMAHSQNQQQFARWRSVLLPLEEKDAARNHFLFWLAVNERIADLKSQNPDRITILRYEDLVNTPEKCLFRLMDALGWQTPIESLISQLDFRPIKPALKDLNISSEEKKRLQRLGY